MPHTNVIVICSDTFRYDHLGSGRNICIGCSRKSTRLSWEWIFWRACPEASILAPTQCRTRTSSSSARTRSATIISAPDEISASVVLVNRRASRGSGFSGARALKRPCWRRRNAAHERHRHLLGHVPLRSSRLSRPAGRAHAAARPVGPRERALRGFPALLLSHARQSHRGFLGPLYFSADRLGPAAVSISGARRSFPPAWLH